MAKYLLVFALFYCCSGFNASAISDSSIVENIHHNHGPDSTSFILFSPAFSDFKNNNTDFLFFHNNINFFLFSHLANNAFNLYNGNLGSYSKNFTSFQGVNYEYFDLISNAKSFSPNNIPYIISDLPASNAFYSMGKNKEQLFNFFHTQKVDSFSSFSLNYNIESSPGLYKNLMSNNSRFFAYYNYYNASKKIALTAGFINNKFTQFENGGITYPNAQFQDTAIYDRQFAEVNLNSAVNNYRNSTFFYKQYYKINNSDSKPLFFSNDFEYTASFRVYENDFSDFYFFDNVLVNPLFTRDSINVRFLNAKFLVSNFRPLDSLSQNFKFFAGYFFKKVNTRNDLERDKFFNHGLLSGFSYNFLSNSNLIALVEIENQSLDLNSKSPDFKFDIAVNHAFDNKFFKSFRLNSSYKLVYPLWIQKHYYSNHFIWDNEFDKQSIFQTQATLNTLFGNLQVCIENLQNLVYFNEYSIPTQSVDNSTNILNLNYNFDFNLKKFVFSGKVGYQKANDTTYIRIPSFYSNLRIGFETPLFNNALILFVGTEAYYFSKFYADVWSPALMAFKIQNNTEIGDFIYPSFLVSARVKKTRFFLMLENFTSGYMPINYYAMPAYPRNDLFFRWGLSWSFYN